MTDIIERLDWLCCGCGKPSPNRDRVCDCATDSLYRRANGKMEHEIKRLTPHEIALQEIETLASRRGPADTIDALRQIQARAKSALKARAVSEKETQTS